MSNFKPQFTISPDSSNYHLLDGKSKSFVYPTYAELKRKLLGVMEEYGVSEVCVSRSRRGEWGEWFEYWHTVNGKLRKGREGWM